MDEVQSGALAPEVPAQAPVAAESATPNLDTTADPGQPPEAMTPEAPVKTFTEEEVNRVVQKRLTKESKRLQREAEARAEAAYYKRLAEERAAPKAEQAHGEPKREQFGSDDEYISAVLDYRVEKQIAAREAKREQETAVQREQRERAERASRIQERLAKGSEKYEDFEERVLGDVPFTPPMVAFLEDSDIAEDVAYHLASNPNEVLRIAKLSPAKQILELGKVQDKLAAPPKVTNAPAPIVPNGSATTVSKDPSTMSDKEFKEWRQRQIAQRRNR